MSLSHQLFSTTVDLSWSLVCTVDLSWSLVCTVDLSWSLVCVWDSTRPFTPYTPSPADAGQGDLGVVLLSHPRQRGAG